MTSYSVDVDSYGLSAYQFMTRNLGAIADASANGNAGPETFGLLYQWGRKDPFPGAAGAGVNSASAIAGKAMTLHGGQMTVEQTIAAPTEFADYRAFTIPVLPATRCPGAKTPPHSSASS